MAKFLRRRVSLFKFSYWQFLFFITLIWIFTRSIVWKKNRNKIEKKVLSREFTLLMVYVCIIVIVRIVYFPWHHINGHIGTLNFDVSKIFPFKINIIPFKFLTDVYDGWQMNIVGNILMFVPVGIIWPFCFKKLNSVWKAFAAGFFFSFCIELSQLMFYDRCSDIDDLFLNSAGVFIGSALYFGMMQVFCRLKSDKI